MTPQQNRLYQWLLARRDDPVCPSFEEMRIAMGLASRAGIHRLVTALEEQGRVSKVPRRANSVRAVVSDGFNGVSTDVLIAEIKRRGAWPQ